MSLLFHVAYKRHLARNDLNRGSEECPSFFPTLDHDQQLKTIGQRILATSAIASKREYCADYKPLREALTAQTIGIQVAKAGVVTFAVAMQEYNVYLDKVIAAQAVEDAGEKVTPVEDFDWKAAQSKYLAYFYTSSNRFVSTFVLRKGSRCIVTHPLLLRHHHHHYHHHFLHLRLYLPKSLVTHSFTHLLIHLISIHPINTHYHPPHPPYQSV